MKLGSIIGSGLLLATALGEAHAQMSVLKTAEAGMVLTGTVEVNPDGSLHGYTIDKRGDVPANVVDIVDKNISQWTFKLSAPTTDVVTSKMSLLVLAKPTSDGKYYATVSGSSFGDNNDRTGLAVSYKTSKPPVYPADAVNARVSGTVFLVARIGRDGTVDDVVAEQVNLDQYGSKAEMDKFRQSLAESSIKAAKKWTYNPPTHGPSMNDPFWLVRVPVHFYLPQLGTRGGDVPYGKWHPYFPGPRQSPSWLSPTLLSEAPDAMPNDGLHTGNSILQLAIPTSGT